MTTPTIGNQFILWDYDARTITKFRREGECNNCGVCCRMKITFAVVNPVEEDNLRQGGWFTSGQGQWVEARVDGHRQFFRMRSVMESDSCCVHLGEDNRCQIYRQRPLLCRTWPHTPFDLVNVPQCSYRFQILGHWLFEELGFKKKANNAKRKTARIHLSDAEGGDACTPGGIDPTGDTAPISTEE